MNFSQKYLSSIFFLVTLYIVALKFKNQHVFFQKWQYLIKIQ